MRRPAKPLPPTLTGPGRRLALTPHSDGLRRHLAPEQKAYLGVMHVRFLLLLGALLLSGPLSPAAAHATLVIGQLEVTPARPAAGAPVSLQLTLSDPTQVPVEDAVVFAELRPAGQPDAEPRRAAFRETETAGFYRAEAELPRAGAYEVVLRDQTYRQEEARARLEAPLRVGGPNEPQGFTFPPTATGGASWRTWLLWLVGLPVVAALLVTVLVLTRGDEKKQGASQ